MPIKLRFCMAFMGLGVNYMTYSNDRNLIISNQIVHFNNWRLSPIPTPSWLPPTHKVLVLSQFCRYGAESELYDSSVALVSVNAPVSVNVDITGDIVPVTVNAFTITLQLV